MATAEKIVLDSNEYTVLLHSYRPWLAKGERVTRTAGGVHDVVFPSASESGWNMVLKCTYDELQTLLTSYAKKEAVVLYPSIHSASLWQYITEGDLNKILTDTVTMLAVQITASCHGTATSVKLYLKRKGSPGGDVRLGVYDDSSGLPGSSITGGSSDWVTISTIGTTESWIEFSLPDEPTLTKDRIYHLVIFTTLGYTYAYNADYLAWRVGYTISGGSCETFTPPTELWADDPEFYPSYRLYGYAAEEVYLLGELSEQTLIPILDGSNSLYHVPIRILKKNA